MTGNSFVSNFVFKIFETSSSFVGDNTIVFLMLSFLNSRFGFGILEDKAGQILETSELGVCGMLRCCRFRCFNVL